MLVFVREICLSTTDSKPARIAVAKPTVTWQSVLPQLEETMQGKYNGINVTLEYLAQDDGSIALTHVIQIQNETRGWYEAFVDAHSGRLLAVTDFVANASVSSWYPRRHSRLTLRSTMSYQLRRRASPTECRLSSAPTVSAPRVLLLAGIPLGKGTQRQHRTVHISHYSLVVLTWKQGQQCSVISGSRSSEAVHSCPQLQREIRPYVGSDCGLKC